MSTDWYAIFRQIAERWVDDAFIPKASEVPNVVYHYTDAAGLVGMLRNDTVWATDYRFLNDKSEVEYTRDLAKQILKEKTVGCSEKLSGFYKALAEYYDAEANDESFIFSLSAERDDLSQWRGYAREGLGFTVGFDGPILHNGAIENESYRFFPVEYQQSRQRNGLERALHEMEDALVKHKNSTPDASLELDEAAASNFDWCYESRAIVNKHQSFRGENEWRVVTFALNENRKGLVKTRVSGQRLVNYVELFIGEKGTGKLPIREIGIGPGFAGPEQASAVEAICRETGYSPVIYSADTPYRRL